MWRSKSKFTQGFIYSTGTESEFLLPLGKNMCTVKFLDLGRERSLHWIFGKSAPATLERFFLEGSICVDVRKNWKCSYLNTKRSYKVWKEGDHCVITYHSIFCVVVIHTTREYGSIVLCYSSCILWQKLVPCRLYASTLLYQGSKWIKL